MLRRTQESERTIAKGGVPLHLDQGTYSLKQKTVILKRTSPETPPRGTNPAISAAAGEAQEQPAAAGSSSQTEPPEILFFWGRNMRRGGNLAVCPDATRSVQRLIQAYLVCEVVYDSKRDTWVEEQADLASAVFCEGKGRAALMGVELGEATSAEQRELEKLISDYRWVDTYIAGVSLAKWRSVYVPRSLSRLRVVVIPSGGEMRNKLTSSNVQVPAASHPPCHLRPAVPSFSSAVSTTHLSG